MSNIWTYVDLIKLKRIELVHYEWNKCAFLSLLIVSPICLDNVTLNIDGVLYLRIRDPYKASYGVEDPEFAITQLAQTTMR